MMSKVFKGFIISIVSGFTFFAFHSGSWATIPSAHTHAFKISILQVIEHPALNATRYGILDELKAHGYVPSKNLILDIENAQGNPNLAAQIAQKFSGDKPDLMIGIGTLATQALVSSSKKQHIPIVFSSVTDPLGARLVDSLTAPTGNVTGISNYVPCKSQLELFRKILPKLNKLGVVYNPGEINSTTLLKEMKQAAQELKITLIEAPANNSADVSAATRSLMGKVDAIFVNNDNTALAAFDPIVQIATQEKIPVFCSDVDMIERGALAALGPNQYNLGRQTGAMIVKLIQEKNVSTAHSPKPMMAVEYPKSTEMRLNTKMAATLGIPLSSSILLFNQKNSPQ